MIKEVRAKFTTHSVHDDDDYDDDNFFNREFSNGGKPMRGKR